MTLSTANPLNWNVPIVNPDRTPTHEFMQKWVLQARFNGLIPTLSTPEQVSAVLDILSGNPNDVLVRGATLWEGWTIQQLLDLAGMIDNRVLMRIGGVWVPATASTLLDTIGGTEGDILRRGASDWETLSYPNDATKYLDGTGNYTVPAGGGGGGDFTLLATYTPTGVVHQDFSIASYGAYASLQVDILHFIAANGDIIDFQVSANSGVSYDSGGSDYKYGHYRISDAGSGNTGGSHGAVPMNNGNGIGNGTAEGANARLIISNWNDAAQKTRFRYDMDFYTDDDHPLRVVGSAYRDAAQATTDLRFFGDSGANFTAVIKVYGLN